MVPGCRGTTATCNSPAERFAEHDNSRFVVPEFISGIVPDTPCVRGEARFRRRTGAVTKTAVVDNEDVKSLRRNFAEVVDSCMTIQGIAREVEDQRRPGGAIDLPIAGVQQPASQRVAIISLQRDINATFAVRIDVCDVEIACNRRLVHQPSLKHGEDDDDGDVRNNRVKKD